MEKPFIRKAPEHTITNTIVVKRSNKDREKEYAMDNNYMEPHKYKSDEYFKFGNKFKYNEDKMAERYIDELINKIDLHLPDEMATSSHQERLENLNENIKSEQKGRYFDKGYKSVGINGFLQKSERFHTTPNYETVFFKHSVKPKSKEEYVIFLN